MHPWPTPRKQSDTFVLTRSINETKKVKEELKEISSSTLKEVSNTVQEISRYTVTISEYVASFIELSERNQQIFENRLNNLQIINNNNLQIINNNNLEEIKKLYTKIFKWSLSIYILYLITIIIHATII